MQWSRLAPKLKPPNYPTGLQLPRLLPPEPSGPASFQPADQLPPSVRLAPPSAGRCGRSDSPGPARQPRPPRGGLLQLLFHPILPAARAVLPRRLGARWAQLGGAVPPAQLRPPPVAAEAVAAGEATAAIDGRFGRAVATAVTIGVGAASRAGAEAPAGHRYQPSATSNTAAISAAKYCHSRRRTARVIMASSSCDSSLSQASSGKGVGSGSGGFSR